MAVDSKRIAKNTVVLYIRMLLLMAVSLYTSRVVLDVLGVDDYGIYNLIGGFVTLFSFISQALVGTMQRFFNVALGKNDSEQYKRLYSMSINIFAIFSLLLIIVGETVGLWFVTTKLNIPAGRETAALWVYQISLFTLIINLFRTSDNASIIAHERMSFYAYISIGEAALKLAIVFMLQAFGHDKLIVYVLLYLVSTVLINGVYWFYCRKHIPLCRFSWMWDKDLCKQLVSFSSWNLLSGGSRVLKSQGEAYLLNHYYSVAVNAAFGVAAQVYNAVNLFLTNFQTAFRPQLVRTYAEGEMDQHYRLLYRSAKFSFYLLLLIVVPVAFNLNDLLGLWLKEVPEYTLQFCLILLMAYLVDAIGAPLGTSVNAQGNIRGMQIWSSVLLLAGLVTSFVFLSRGAEPWIVAEITFAVHVGFMLVYMYYARKLCHVRMRTFFRQVILPISSAFVLSLVIPITIRGWGEGGFWAVLAKCVVDVAWVAAAVFVVGLAKDEKEYLKIWIFRILKINNKQIYDNQHVNYPPPTPQSPVLIIGFNRPDTTQQVFDAVRAARPSTLYFAVDGPRQEKEGEKEKVQQVRDIVKQVDWPCDVHTLFREENVGCGFGPAGAITWALENEDRMIVLEDDCVPSQSFFRFCNEMLERYKNDTRINIVSGRSFHPQFFSKYDYLFTRYAHTWGWATWKRAWNEFDIYMSDVPDFVAEGGAENIEQDNARAKRRNRNLLKKYEAIDKEVTHSWDSQWSYARFKTGLGIVPSHNLIHNIGNIGTHSYSLVNRDIAAEEMPEVLKHPHFVMVNREYENYHYRNYIRKKPSIIKRAWNKLNREIRKKGSR